MLWYVWGNVYVLVMMERFQGQQGDYVSWNCIMVVVIGWVSLFFYEIYGVFLNCFLVQLLIVVVFEGMVRVLCEFNCLMELRG